MGKRGRRRIFLDKRGQTNEIYHILIQLLIAVTIYMILQSYIDSVAKDTLFEKSYLSKDLALLTNTIYGGPGEVKYLYVNDEVELGRFEFDFSDGKVKVGERGVEADIGAEYPYAEDLKFQYFGERITWSDKILLSKTGDKLEITK